MRMARLVTLWCFVASSSFAAEWRLKGHDALLDAGGGHTRGTMLSLFVGVPWFSTYHGPLYSTALAANVGGRFSLPIVTEGFLPMLNDSFGVEFGVDVFLGLPGFSYAVLGAGVQVPAEARWNFHLFPRLEVYAKLGAALEVLFTPVVWLSPIVIANVGAVFKLSEAFYVRAEVGSPAMKVGLGVIF